jgi:hypothetical protein
MPIRYVCSAVGAAALVLRANARAEACSCPADGAAGVWPRDGMLGAAVNTPLVVEATDLGRVTPTLVAEDGTVVELREQRRLVPPGEFSCLKSSYAFLAAANELTPNTRYTFTAHFEKPGDGERTDAVTFDRSLSFVTGTERRDPAPPEVRLSLFGVPLGPKWGLYEGTLLDVYVETAAVEPLFVLAHGQSDILVHVLDPLGMDRPFRVGFGSVECGLRPWAGARGRACPKVVTARRCCAALRSLGPRPMEGWGWPCHPILKCPCSAVVRWPAVPRRASRQQRKRAHGRLHRRWVAVGFQRKALQGTSSPCPAFCSQRCFESDHCVARGDLGRGGRRWLIRWRSADQ